MFLNILGGAPWVFAAVFFVISFIRTFYTYALPALIISAILTICFGLYIIYDTQQIISEKVQDCFVNISRIMNSQ
jgi:FtsH-binding integral membrane protein